MEWQVVQPIRLKEMKTPIITLMENGTIIFSTTALKEMQTHTPDQDIDALDKADLIHNEETGEYAFKFGTTGNLTIKNVKDQKYKRTYNKRIIERLNYTGKIYVKRYEPSMMIFEIKEKEEG